MDAETAPIKYIFLDIVGFTKDRSVEAQSDIITQMNRIVRESILSYSIPKEQLIILPTGDGLCIAIIDMPKIYDIHLLIALKITELINNYNSGIEDAKRRFQVRIALNENVDNLVTDFNGQRNVAGAGISLAQRIMENADGNQIIISTIVYETLRHRDKYMNLFRTFTAKGKHGQTFSVYQYIGKEHIGLNIEIPSNFTPRQAIDKRLPELLAYYLAHALLNQEFFVTKNDPDSYPGIVLLYFLSCDSETASNASYYEKPQNFTHGAGRLSFEEQFKYYDDIDFWVICRFAREIANQYLYEFYYCFEGANFLPAYCIVSEKGKSKLKKDWPEIWQEFFGESETQN
jgi:hypothetical protein